MKQKRQTFVDIQSKILKRQKPKIQEVKNLVEEFIEIQKNEKIVLNLTEPVFVIGSLHGQFEQFQSILQLIGSPPSCSILFLGNYVNFGSEQFFLYMYILTLKVLHPKFVFLLRGGHESQSINKIFGFYQEIMHIFQSNYLWRQITQTYRYLSLAAILNKSKIICLAGGLSPHLQTLNQIKKIQCKNEIDSDSILSDLLWSIPQQDDSVTEFKFAQSGLGYTFPLTYTQKFLQQNKLTKIIRTDSYIQEGLHRSQQDLVISIFSCLELNKQKTDKAGFIFVKENGIIEEQFKKKIFAKINIQIYHVIPRRNYE